MGSVMPVGLDGVEMRSKASLRIFEDRSQRVKDFDLETRVFLRDRVLSSLRSLSSFGLARMVDFWTSATSAKRPERKAELTVANFRWSGSFGSAIVADLFLRFICGIDTSELSNDALGLVN